ncbi:PLASMODESMATA CALLOSE-BINDING PROTEIN 3-like [Olea europaea var. sylvestris]|uniref:X8 domain-containing protein n=1 Tax=Olea europaea subsp. europaea TaxID=158383 RepID=A0A8S0PMS8_OLEEU|nr:PLASMODESMATA CALLOSE-BINDING PROTEIN 3-like [Olea europaea var. sylvestris]CAA2955600.1 Hypothetical predicted protein [Olea europaea subsp. europaea]
MDAFLLSLLFLFAITGHSEAAYCVCNEGLSTDAYQKNIDYACGAGADCNPITQNGPCYNPNTVKDHCNYAVNSYFQRKGQNPQSCSFSNTATVSQSAPSSSNSGCVYPSSSSNASTSPSTTPPTGTTPSTGTTPTTGGPPTMGGTPTGGTPSTMVPGTTTTGSPGLGLGPTGSGFTNTDSSAASVTLVQGSTLFMSISLTFFISGLMNLMA